MHLRFVFAFVLAYLGATLAFAEEAAVAEKPAPVEVCTIPSFQLLVPESSGTTSGSASSAMAGTGVFLHGSMTYLACVGRKIERAEVAAGKWIARFVHAVASIGHKKTLEPDASQPADQ